MICLTRMRSLEGIQDSVVGVFQHMPPYITMHMHVSTPLASSAMHALSTDLHTQVRIDNPIMRDTILALQRKADALCSAGNSATGEGARMGKA